MKFLWIVSAALLLTTNSSPGVLAQSPSLDTRVSGTVTDDVGGTIPKAAITFKSKKFTKIAIASEDGKYELELPAGTYEVTVKFQGCKDFRLRDWNAHSSGSMALDIALYCPPTPVF